MSSILGDQPGNQLLANLPQIISSLKTENKTVDTNTSQSGIMGSAKSNENTTECPPQKKCECGGYTSETVFLMVFVAICLVLSLVWVVSGFMDMKSGSGSSSSSGDTGVAGSAEG